MSPLIGPGKPSDVLDLDTAVTTSLRLPATATGVEDLMALQGITDATNALAAELLLQEIPTAPSC